MSDPYYLRKANIDGLDLSSYEKDFTPEELAQAKEALKLAQQQHQQEFDNLPVTERAKYHVADLTNYVTENPQEAGLYAAAAYGVGTGINKVAKADPLGLANKVHGSLRDFMKSKSDDGLLANQQAEKAAAQQQDLTPKEVSAKAVPTTGVDVEANVGKPPSQAEKVIVEQGVGNTERKAAAKQVSVAQKELAEGISKGLPPPNLTTGSGMPAYQGAAPEGTRLSTNIPSLDKVPKNMVFVPEGQYMDIVRNATGQQAYTENLKSTGGYPATPNAAYTQSREINKSLGRATRDQAIAAGSDLGDVTKSITKKVGAGKTVKVAGVGGALISLADLANAASEGTSAAKEGDSQVARGYATDVIGALTGPLGMIASQVFGTSPEDIRTLRAADQAKKIGAGRGIAPPSAYQR